MLLCLHPILCRLGANGPCCHEHEMAQMDRRRGKIVTTDSREQFPKSLGHAHMQTEYGRLISLRASC